MLLTSITALIYVAALVLPLIYDYCPYATALSRLIKPYPGTWSRRRECQTDSSDSGNMVPMDATTSRALAWMIRKSEVPKSVDHTLQAIAGTSFDMPNEALWDCGVPEAINQRLRDCLEDPNYINIEQLYALEASAPATFSSPIVYAHALSLVSKMRQEHQAVHTGAEGGLATEVDLMSGFNGLYAWLVFPRLLVHCSS